MAVALEHDTMVSPCFLVTLLKCRTKCEFSDGQNGATLNWVPRESKKLKTKARKLPCWECVARISKIWLT